MSSPFGEAPQLPREPTLIRDAALSAPPRAPPAAPAPPASPPPFPDGPDLQHASAQPQRAAPPPAPPAPPAPKEMPLPPTFPSIHDEPAWTSPQPAPTARSARADSAPSRASTAAASASPSPSPSPSPSQPVHDVAWNRASYDNLSASLSQPSLQPEHAASEERAKRGVFAAFMAVFKRAKPPADAAQPPSPPSTPPLQNVKQLVCKLPDPTLIFVLHASLILLLHTFVPHVLRSWPARIVVPLLLVPTVAATALWRRTIVIAKPGTRVASLVKPIPNAGKVVSMGETLRAREAAVIAAEQHVREGHMRLEMLRKEIEARLPPQESITTLLESEQRAQDES